MIQENNLKFDFQNAVLGQVLSQVLPGVLRSGNGRVRCKSNCFILNFVIDLFFVEFLSKHRSKFSNRCSRITGCCCCCVISKQCERNSSNKSFECQCSWCDGWWFRFYEFRSFDQHDGSRNHWTISSWCDFSQSSPNDNFNCFITKCNSNGNIGNVTNGNKQRQSFVIVESK